MTVDQAQARMPQAVVADEMIAAMQTKVGAHLPVRNEDGSPAGRRARVRS